MCYLYILRNSETNRYYIGSTSNLTRRLREHRSGKTRTTRVLGTYELAYTERYGTIEEARTREKKLKSYKSKRYIEWLISQKSS